MFRSILFAGALLSAGALSAQEVAISGKDFLSGAGDAKIAELARQAAASGKTIVITAPPYWQDKAAAKVHSGAANASVRMSDAFFENVMVKVEDSKTAAKTPEPPAKAAAAKVEARPAETRPEVKPEPRPAPPVRKQAEEAPAPAPKPAPVEAPPPPPPPVEVKPEPVAAPPPPAPAPVAAAPAPAPVAAAKPAADPKDAIKKRFEQNLNAGQPADGSLSVAQLQKDDLIYANGPVLAVVRRFGPRNQLFWLDGELNLERSELVVTGPDRYRVSEPIRNLANPTLRGGSTKGAAKFVAAVPAAKSPARAALEKQYNDGRDIVGVLAPTELHAGDLIYTTEGAAVVIRRSSVGMERFWFVGDLDLHQTGLQLQGNAIRVTTDTIK